MLIPFVNPFYFKNFKIKICFIHLYFIFFLISTDKFFIHRSDKFKGVHNKIFYNVIKNQIENI